MSDTEKFKSTIDTFINEVRKTCHAMIDQKYVSESPVALVKEALEYLDEKYDEAKKKDS